MLADELRECAELDHAQLAVVIRVESLEHPLRRKAGARRAAIGTRTTVRTVTITGHAVAIGSAWWRAVVRRTIWGRWAAGTARFAVVSPTTAWAVGTFGAAISTARTTRTAEAALAVATTTITIAGTAAFRTTAFGAGTLRREFFANRHA
jgi:hypothetical protein